VTKHRKGGALRAQVKRVTRYVPVWETYWEQTCAVCGKKFISTRSDALYDTPACRAKAYRQRKEDRERLLQMQELEPLFGKATTAPADTALDLRRAFPWSTNRP
jgi:hypothetical protein